MTLSLKTVVPVQPPFAIAMYMWLRFAPIGGAVASGSVNSTYTVPSLPTTGLLTSVPPLGV
ncbi:MAG: hypothetical protein E6G41_01005 [Actinobacteria bacterium]|nr:MAG: hypothetical protein E6G41_01005 [Actinomycetota bacterium]